MWDLTEVLESWKDSIFEFKDALSLDEVVKTPKNRETAKNDDLLTTQWQKPMFGFIKVNTDAAWCNQSMRAREGWVARDFAGLLQAADGTGKSVCHSAAAAEACAIRGALEACIDRRFDHVIIEFDAKVIIQMIKKEVALDFSLECILGDIEMLARRLTSVTFAFVSRQSNCAAHLVAKFVFKESREFSWDHISPDFWFNILAEDVHISIRL